MPLLPQVIHKFFELGIDRWMYCMNMSRAVRCGPNQYSKLYSILQESARVLDMPEPELYLASYPHPNAMAFGGRYWATEIGLINSTGLICWTTDPASFTNLRIGL